MLLLLLMGVAVRRENGRQQVLGAESMRKARRMAHRHQLFSRELWLLDCELIGGAETADQGARGRFALRMIIEQ